MRVARLSLALVPALLAACGKAPPPETATTYVGPFSVVVVETGAGRVEFSLGADDGSVTVEKLPSTDGTSSVSEADGQLALLATCTGGDEAGCGVGFLVSVPPDITIAAKSASGEIAFVGLSGELAAQTASGDVRGEDLGEADVTVLTGTGVVDTVFTETPGSLSYDTGSSAITATVPAGTYSLDLDTTGLTTVNDAIEDGGGPPIRLHSGTGNITLTTGS